MTIRRKLLSLLLCVALIASGLPLSAMLPVVASAEGNTGAFTVTGGTYDTDYSYADGVLTILTDKELTISNTDNSTSTTDRIVIGSGVTANLTLAGVNIAAPDGKSAIDVPNGASLNITLAAGSQNNLKGGNGSGGYPTNNCAGSGIHLPTGADLNIGGTGELTVNGGNGNIDSSYGGTGIGGYSGGTSYTTSVEGCGDVTINGGKISITGGTGYSSVPGGAGIGGGSGNPGGTGGTVIINDGVVIITGGSGEYIGGSGVGGGSTLGEYSAGAGGTVIITGGSGKIRGGTGTASSNTVGGAGIGGGAGGTTSSTGGAGATVVILTDDFTITGGNGAQPGNDIGGGIGFYHASAGGNKTGATGDGIKPSGTANEYVVYGDLTLPGGVLDGNTYTIPQGVTVNVPEGTSLTVPEGVNLIVNGTLDVEGTLTNNGAISGDGTLTGSGSFTNNGTNSIATNAFTTTVSVSIFKDCDTVTSATIRDTITLTATVKNGLEESVTDGTVTFYQGDSSSGTLLNSGGTLVSNGTATYTINNLDWPPSETDYTITAVYTPAEGSSQQPANGTTTLTVNAAQLPAPTGLNWNGTTATWTQVENATGYTVQLYRGNDKVGEAVTVTSGTSYNFASDMTEAGSYTFTVTATSTSANYSDSTASTVNTVLTYYTVTFSTDGGSAVASQVVRDGQTATKPDPDPTKTGYTFGEWKKDNNTFNFNTQITSDTTLTATWTANDYNVTLNYNGGTGSSLTSYTYGEGATLPADGTRAGYTFDGWYTDSSLSGSPVTSISTTETEAKEFWAKWTLNAPTVNVTSAPTGAVTYGTTVTLTANARHEAGDDVNLTYQWYKDSDAVNGATNSTLELKNVADSGNYYVVVTATDKESNTASIDTKTSAITVTISQAEQAQPGAGEGYTIDYDAETIVIREGYEVYTAKENGTKINSGAVLSLSTEPYTLFIRKAEQGNYEASGWTEITIPARPAISDLAISNASESVTIPAGYCYGFDSASYDAITTAGDGSAVIVPPGSSIYIYKAAVTSGEEPAFKSAILTLTAPARAAAQEVSISYSAETVSTTAAMEYSTDGGNSWTACTANMSVANWFGQRVQFRTAATGEAYASDPISLDIPSRPDAPADVRGSIYSIYGVGTTMEYSANGTSWIPCDGTTVGNLNAGTYYVRYSATATEFASESVTVQVQSYVPPITPSTPAEPDDDGPTTDGSAGWSDIQTELEAAGDGDTITVEMNGTTEVPAEIFETIAGQDITVSFEMEGGVSWQVNGTDIPAGTSLSDLNLGVDMNTNGISANVINAITGEISTVQITLAYDGEFGFTMTLSAPLGEENHGYWANLYYFNEAAQQLVYQTASLIDETGHAHMRMSHASQYAIVIDDYDHGAGLPFTDVSANDWYYDAVAYVFDAGIMGGTSSTTFEPQIATTRAMIVSMLHRLEGAPSAEASGFSDVSANDWYAGPVAWAASVGVVGGYDDGTFQPNKSITREELASILYRYAQYKGYDVSARADLTAYTDAPSPWAADVMAWANAEGLINGRTATTIDAQATLTRGETAAIFQRFIG